MNQFAPLALSTLLLVACGKTVPTALGIDGGAVDAGAREAGRDASKEAASDADAATCVDVELQTGDTDCNVDSDCTLVGATGKVCFTECCGGGAVANQAAARRIQAEEAVIHNGICPGGCPAQGGTRCVDGTCIACPPGFRAGPPACVDASAPDGATCIHLDATYGAACQQASDCAAVLIGTICSTTCSCEANTAISTSWLAAYQSDLGGITLETCHCTPAQVTCVAEQCVLCPTPGTPNPPQGCD